MGIGFWVLFILCSGAIGAVFINPISDFKDYSTLVIGTVVICGFIAICFNFADYIAYNMTGLFL